MGATKILSFHTEWLEGQTVDGRPCEDRIQIDDSIVFSLFPGDIGSCPQDSCGTEGNGKCPRERIEQKSERIPQLSQIKFAASFEILEANETQLSTKIFQIHQHPGEPAIMLVLHKKHLELWARQAKSSGHTAIEDLRVPIDELSGGFEFEITCDTREADNCTRRCCVSIKSKTNEIQHSFLVPFEAKFEPFIKFGLYRDSRDENDHFVQIKVSNVRSGL